MKYRISTQRNKSDSEQNISITDNEEDVKRRYLNKSWTIFYTIKLSYFHLETVEI